MRRVLRQSRLSTGPRHPLPPDRRRRRRSILSTALALVAGVSALGVVHGAGIPVTAPGVAVVLVVLFAARLSWAHRRQRRRRRMSSPSRAGDDSGEVRHREPCDRARVVRGRSAADSS